MTNDDKASKPDEWPQRWADGPDLGPAWQRARQQMVHDARTTGVAWSGGRAARVWGSLQAGAQTRRLQPAPLRLVWILGSLLLGGGITTAGTLVLRARDNGRPPAAVREPHQRKLMAAAPPVIEAPAAAQIPAVAAPDEPPPTSEPALRSIKREPADWRRLAHKGNYAAAYERLFDATRQGARLDPESELLAADVARLSGHLEEAVWRLERLLAHKRNDERAAAAAFTLGRVQLDERGAAEPAARAFELSFELRPHSVLAEDALARAALAWSRAGNGVHAKALAVKALERYPQSVHVARLRALLHGNP